MSNPYLQIHPNDPNIRVIRINSYNSDRLGHSDRLPHSDRSGGFTLLELLLSVAIIAILAGLSLPVYKTLLSKNDLDIAATVTASTLRRAQILSQAVDGDTTWGIKVQSGSIALFKGASFASRDTTFDESFDVPTTISVGGTTEIVFAKLTGLPQTTGTVSLSSESDTKSVTINEKGTVNY